MPRAKTPNVVKQRQNEIKKRLRTDRMTREPVVIDLPDQSPVTRSFMTPEQLVAAQANRPSKVEIEKQRKKYAGATMVGNMARQNREGDVRGSKAR